MTTYASEPGTRLGGRYRLEDRIAAGGGWDAWKAIDETLARAVTVFTLAPGFPRTTEVVTAARAASRLSDPRIAQVFDVEESWQRPYMVMEWAAGETLGDMLSQGPLEPDRAARMIAEAAAALATAHGSGVAHMCLSPGSVRWSPTGEVKVVGLGIDAALSGVSADNPVLADTIGLGKLLYAALTGCWPGPEFAALPPAPTADGLPRAPRQVLAGVPSVLSDLSCQAMQLSVRGAEPVTNPDQLARALLAVVPPPVVPPAPVPPRRHDPRRQDGPGPVPDYWPGSERDGRSDWSEPTSWDARPGWDRPGWDRPGRDRSGRDRSGRDRSGRAGPANGPGPGGRRDEDDGWSQVRADGWAGPADPSAGRGDSGGPGQSDYGSPQAHWLEADRNGQGMGPGGRTGAPRGGRAGQRRAGPGSGQRAGRLGIGSRSGAGRPVRSGRPLAGRIPHSGMVAAGIGVIAVAVLAITLWPGGSSAPPAQAGKPSGSSAPATAQATLTPVGASGYDPLTSVKGDPGNEQSAYAKYAIDGDPKTAWQSQWYRTARFGGLKAGSGLMLDMGKPVQAEQVTIALGPQPGASLELLVANSATRSAANLASMRNVASATNVSGTITLRISHPASGRYLVIWFTTLPPKPGSGHWYMAQVFDVSVRGTS